VSVELTIARRYLRAHGSRFVSVLTVISVAGVALGVLTLIVVLAVMNGFREEVRTRILGATPHLMVMRNDREPLSDYGSVMTQGLTDAEVTGAAPFVFGKGLVSCGGEADGVVIRGLDPHAERRVTRIMESVDPPDADLVAAAGELPPAVVGREIAFSLHAARGDTILVTTVSSLGAGALGYTPRSVACRVVGTFHSGMYDFDASLVFIPLPTAQRLFGLGEGVSGVSFRVEDLYRAREVGARLVRRLGPGEFNAVDWMELNPNLFSWMELEKVMMFLLLIMIVLVAAFNIASTLIMMVLEKTRDIGVLQAMGASRGRVRRIFMWEGLLIGAAGTVLGVAGGILVASLLSRYRIIRLPPDVYFIDRLPVRLEWGDILVTAACALVISFLATLYPSRRAVAMPPVEAIRHE